jgi:predicted GTPase
MKTTSTPGIALIGTGPGVGKSVVSYALLRLLAVRESRLATSSRSASTVPMTPTRGSFTAPTWTSSRSRTTQP